jgi:hypothetical protein
LGATAELSLNPLTKMSIARWSSISGILLVPLFGFAFDTGLLVGTAAFAAWSTAFGWYIENNRWLPQSMRSQWKRLAWLYGIKRRPHDVTVNHVGFAHLGVTGTGILLFYTDLIHE